MILGIEGRVAMVAAASKGLGRASALALAREGVAVSICARHEAALEGTAAELREAGAAAVHTAIVDVAVEGDLHRWFDQTVAALGRVDILVTNTGGPPAATFAALSDAQWFAGVDSTLMNVVRLSRLVLPGMQARRWGRLIHLTSFVAREPMALLTISSTLRAGISALTRTLATQVGPDGVTCNAVLPGHAMTDRQLHLADVRGAAEGITREQYFERAAAEIPLRRIGDAREIGDVVAFLASERASYVTGQSITVDGGLARGTF